MSRGPIAKKKRSLTYVGFYRHIYALGNTAPSPKPQPLRSIKSTITSNAKKFAPLPESGKGWASAVIIL